MPLSARNDAYKGHYVLELQHESGDNKWVYQKQLVNNYNRTPF